MSTSNLSSVMTDAFANAELSEPIPVGIEYISVTVVGDTEMAHTYVQAFLTELERKSEPVKRTLALTEDDLFAYLMWTIKQRVAVVNGEPCNRRVLRQLWVPAFWTLVLESIGVVWDKTRGLKMTPVFDQPNLIADDEALEISEKLQIASNVIACNQGFPFDEGGDQDVMMCSLINETVTSSAVIPAVKEVIAAYMGLTVEAKYHMLYRWHMDEVDYLKQANRFNVTKLVS